MTAAERLAFAQGALSAELLAVDILHCTSTGRLEKTIPLRASQMLSQYDQNAEFFLLQNLAHTDTCS